MKLFVGIKALPLPDLAEGKSCTLAVKAVELPADEIAARRSVIGDRPHLRAGDDEDFFRPGADAALIGIAVSVEENPEDIPGQRKMADCAAPQNAARTACR